MFEMDQFAKVGIVLLEAIVVITVCLQFCVVNFESNPSDLKALWQGAKRIWPVILNEGMKHLFEKRR